MVYIKVTKHLKTSVRLNYRPVQIYVRETNVYCPLDS